MQIGKKVFRERVVIIENQLDKYILVQVLHRSYQYSTTGRHYITINWQAIVQVILQTKDYPIIKIKGNVTLLPMSVSIIEVRTPKIMDSTNLYKLNADTFQLLEGINPLKVLYMVDHIISQYISILTLMPKNDLCGISKNMQITTMHPAGKCNEVQEISWSKC